MAIAAFAALLFWAHSSFDAKRPDMTAAPAAAAKAEPVTLSPSAETSVPSFDADAATHLATVFPMQGVRQINDASPAVSLFPPDSSLTVQVIERDSLPRPLTDGVTVRYRLKNAYAGGRNKDAATGDLDADAGNHSFTSDGIAVTPYASDKPRSFQPHPVAGVEVLGGDGALLAATTVALPVSDETGCRNCHGGPWKGSAAGGISAGTATDFLSVHNRHNDTGFTAMVKDGDTVQCVSCHSDLGEEPNLSTAIYGFHATMDLGGAEACGLCHAFSKQGPTQFYCGYHNMWRLGCTRCHGALADHAISLLRHEAERGSPAAGRRLAQLQSVAVAEAAAINPREPDVNLPQCAGCHDFEKSPMPPRRPPSTNGRPPRTSALPASLKTRAKYAAPPATARRTPSTPQQARPETAATISSPCNTRTRPCRSAKTATVPYATRMTCPFSRTTVQWETSTS